MKYAHSVVDRSFFVMCAMQIGMKWSFCRDGNWMYGCEVAAKLVMNSEHPVGLTFVFDPDIPGKAMRLSGSWMRGICWRASTAPVLVLRLERVPEQEAAFSAPKTAWLILCAWPPCSCLFAVPWSMLQMYDFMHIALKLPVRMKRKNFASEKHTSPQLWADHFS